MDGLVSKPPMTVNVDPPVEVSSSTQIANKTSLGFALIGSPTQILSAFTAMATQAFDKDRLMHLYAP